MRDFLLKCSRALFHWPPAPASFLEKQQLITRTGRKFTLHNFVETGTFRGEMLDAQAGHFKKLFSIELNDELFAAASAKYARDARVQLFHGDSGIKLREVAQGMNEPALFWLDAHYSRGKTAGGDADAPIIRELTCLIGRPYPDAILIDDARLFGLKSDYPKLQVIQDFAAANWPRHEFNVQSDIICLLPARSGGE